jgi:hypothetical protein
MSDATRRVTIYDYHVYTVNLGGLPSPDALHPDFCYFTFDELLKAINVTSSTQTIAQALVENRKVAAAVIPRTAPRGQEFLLVKNRLGEYFFPSARMKTSAIPKIAITNAIVADLGYEDEIDVPRQAEVPVVQDSTRFGARLVKFYFHPCLVQFKGIDLNARGNPLETSLKKLAPASGTNAYSDWFTESELRTRPDMSPSVAVVLNTVLQLVG